MNMRISILLAACGALVLGGCSGTGGAQVKAEEINGFNITQGIGKRVLTRLKDGPPAPPADPRAVLTPALIDAAGVPLMLMETANPRSFTMMQLVAERRGYAQWRSPASQGLTLRGGIVTATQGLFFDRMDTDVEATLSALQGQGPRSGYPRIHRLLDSESQMVVHGYVCDLTREGSETLRLAGRSFATQVWRESCTGQRENFENTYWIEASGKMRASEQWVATGAPSLRLEALTP